MPPGISSVVALEPGHKQAWSRSAKAQGKLTVFGASSDSSDSFVPYHRIQRCHRWFPLGVQPDQHETPRKTPGHSSNAAMITFL
ncbi:hypothetical protein PC114_g14156 [Phytophthora cactorum]|nr:hypothetical protein PC114_g14156 [Phytophthora cactorum]